MREKGGYMYIMASRRNGTLHTGVTSDISGRVWEHREGVLPDFTKRYGVKTLVWYGAFDDIRDAIQWEKTIKKYPRAWKINLIEDMNPGWRCLYEDIVW
jgi:putative endonuclease